MKPAKPLKRLGLGLLVVVLVAAGVAIFRSRDETEIGKTVTFSDVTTLTLKAVTFGTVHRSPRQFRWDRWRDWSLRRLIAEYRGSSYTSTSSTPQFAFWITQHASTNPAANVPYPILTLRDANGFEVGYGGPGDMMGLRLFNHIRGRWFECWPRREPTFTLCVYEEGPNDSAPKKIGEFTIHNPTPGIYPVWTAPLPPLTSQAGDLSVTLVDLKAGVQDQLWPLGDWKPARNPIESEARAHFQIEQNGKLTQDWKIVGWEASDATGNQLTHPDWNGSSDKSGEYLWLRPQLWPVESAWKIRIALARHAHFAAADLWTLRIPVPDVNVANRAAIQTNLQNTRLEYEEQEQRPWMDNIRQLGSYRFRISPARTNFQFTLVKAIDNAGRKAELYFSGSHPAESNTHFDLITHTNITSLDLTFAFQERRYFDFLVKPQIISSNEPPRSRKQNAR